MRSRNHSKSIKSIRIIPASQNSHSSSKFSNKSSAQQFSFKKPSKQNISPIQAKQTIDSQQQWNHLNRMIHSMFSKKNQQIMKINELNAKLKEYEPQKQLNIQLKNELRELKQLMKELLLQRQQEKIFQFYQQNK